MRALAVAPRLSGGVAHAMAASASVRCQEGGASVQKTPCSCNDLRADLDPDCPDDLVPYLRERGSVKAALLRLVPHLMSQPNPVRTGVAFRVHVGARVREHVHGHL